MGIKTWLNNLFSATEKPAPEQETIEYKGFQIQPAPQPEGSQFRTAGFIRKQIGDASQQHHLIRADVHPSLEQAVEHTVFKAKQVIDQQGERIFEAPPV